MVDITQLNGALWRGFNGFRCYLFWKDEDVMCRRRPYWVGISIFGCLTGQNPSKYFDMSCNFMQAFGPCYTAYIPARWRAELGVANVWSGFFFFWYVVREFAKPYVMQDVCASTKCNHSTQVSNVKLFLNLKISMSTKHNSWEFQTLVDPTSISAPHYPGGVSKPTKEYRSNTTNASWMHLLCKSSVIINLSKSIRILYNSTKKTIIYLNLIVISNHQFYP